MSSLQFPPGSRFSCQSCAQCCRNWTIIVTAAEHDRISAHDWVAEDPSLKDVKLFDHEGVSPVDRSARYKIHLKPDGVCPFLMPEGLCRIHKTLGGRAKPLACQVYPYTFTWTPEGTFAGLKFSCPTVARNKGNLLSQDREVLQEMMLDYQREAGAAAPPVDEPVPAGQGHRIAWDDVEAIERGFAACFDDPVPFTEQFRRACGFLHTLSEADLTRIRGRVAEFVKLTGEGGKAGQAPPPSGPPRLGGIDRFVFRRLLHKLCLRETTAYRRSGWKGRMAIRLRAWGDYRRFVFNAGALTLTGLPGPVPMAAIDSISSPVTDPAVEELLRRYVLTRVYGKNYFGVLYRSWGQVPALQFLLLVQSAVCWFARVSACSRGAGETSLDDFVFAVRYVDYTLGSSAVFKGIASRAQFAPLLKPQAIERLFLHFVMSPPKTTGAPALAPTPEPPESEMPGFRGDGPGAQPNPPIAGSL